MCRFFNLLLMRYFITSIVFCAFVLCVGAQDIVHSIESDSSVTLIQSQKLAERVRYVVESRDNTEEESVKSDDSSAQPVAGYRVLAFSDNNANTARNEARERARQISERLPQYRTYITYESPFWRLRVGDFKTIEAAEEAADEIRHNFPQFSREVRVVKDRIRTN